MKFPFSRTRLQQWWDEWWRRDYSWEGLSRHGTRDGEALQQYWRRGAGSDRQTQVASDAELDDEMLASGELVRGPGGKIWHLAHVPHHWRDGSVAKADPGFDTGRLKSLLAARLNVASAEHRAELAGVVWSDQLAHSHPNRQIEANFSRSFVISVSPGQNYGTVDFGGAYFQRFDASSSRFRGQLSFDEAVFERTCDLSGAVFEREVTFRRATFQQAGDFGGCAFSSATAFGGARFFGPATFDSARIGQGGTFNAVFAQTPSFSGATVDPSVSFSGVRVTSLSRFRPLPWAIFACTAVAALAAVQALTLSPWVVCPVALAVIVALLIFDPMATTGEMDLEAGRARVLMEIASKNRNHLDEAQFFRLQLKAIRSAVIRTSRSPGRLAEQLLGVLYEALSDYGLSIIRPLVWLCIIWIVFAVGYYAWESGGVAMLTVKNASLVEALTYSGSRMLPVGPWGELALADGMCSFSERLLHSGAAGTSNGEVPCEPSGPELGTAASVAVHRLAVIATSTLQSLIAIVLFFLEGLAVRRRFQIG